MKPNIFKRHYVEFFNQIKSDIEKGFKESENPELYIANRKSDIEIAAQKDIDTTVGKFKNNTEVIRRFLKFFYIGRGVKYPVVDFVSGRNYVEAICLDVSFNKKADNPFSPSNINFSFALSDSTRRMDAKGSNKFQTELSSIIGSSYHMTESASKNIIENWDSTIKDSTVNRRTAYIVTGNILQGYGKFNKGKLISYSLKEGGIKKGILMPLGYKPNSSSTGGTDNYVNVPVLMAYKYIKSSSSGSTIRTNTDIQLQRHPEAIKIYLPSSKSKGGKYFLDDDILNLTKSGNFDKIGSFMVDYVEDDNLQEFLKILQDKFSVSALIPQSRIDEIEDINKLIVSPKNSDKINSKTNKAKILRLRAKALSVKQKQLVLKNIIAA